MTNTGLVKQSEFDRWVDAYSDGILRVCYLYLKDYALAQDALQDTFLKAWLHMDQFHSRNGTGEKAWLMRIAVNTCKNYRRSAWMRRVTTQEILPEQDGLTDHDSALYLDIMNLPLKMRNVIVLHYYQRLPINDVAKILSLSRSNAYHLLNKAVKQLGGKDT